MSKPPHNLAKTLKDMAAAEEPHPYPHLKNVTMTGMAIPILTRSIIRGLTIDSTIEVDENGNRITRTSTP